MKTDWRLLLKAPFCLAVICGLWFSPITHDFCQSLDVYIFKTLNGSLENNPSAQWFWGILNHRLETKLNLLIAALFNMFGIFMTKNQELRKIRIKQTLYFWVCFQLGFMLQDNLFNRYLEIKRDSPSLVFPNSVHLSTLWQNINIKDSSQHSFPSGHAFSMIYWALFTLLSAPKKVSIVGFIFAVMLCVPRLVSGAHWFSDVIFSALLAFIWLSWTIHTPIYRKITIQLR